MFRIPHFSNPIYIFPSPETGGSESFFLITIYLNKPYRESICYFIEGVKTRDNLLKGKGCLNYRPVKRLDKVDPFMIQLKVNIQYVDTFTRTFKNKSYLA